MSGESKKEEFRKYLERSGVIDALTKVLVALYEEPEKPANALDFIKQYLGAPTSGDVETMKAEKDELVKKNEEQKKELEVLPTRPAAAPCVRGVALRCVRPKRVARILSLCAPDANLAPGRPWRARIPAGARSIGWMAIGAGGACRSQHLHACACRR